MVRTALKYGTLVIVGGLLLIQLVPYGRAHDNPPVTQAAALSPEGQKIVDTSCADCHSNLTDWRWYSNIAPASWLVTNDVDEGRSELNFSEWDAPQPPLRELLAVVSEGEMPPLKYTLPHPSAKLSDAEKQQLERALTALYATDPPPIRAGE
ncbi:MAG: heme-binding domain-containing protein [Solirubrobacteraceae bacterium]|nr:heme-binding domain-containing protein [Solirubrobacteraceae bacterium]